VNISQEATQFPCKKAPAGSPPNKLKYADIVRLWALKHFSIIPSSYFISTDYEEGKAGAALGSRKG
jgi:hypothetical protein